MNYPILLLWIFENAPINIINNCNSYIVDIFELEYIYTNIVIKS